MDVHVYTIMPVFLRWKTRYAQVCIFEVGTSWEKGNRISNERWKGSPVLRFHVDKIQQSAEREQHESATPSSELVAILFSLHTTLLVFFLLVCLLLRKRDAWNEPQL
jgi:hypothetical protein